MYSEIFARNRGQGLLFVNLVRRVRCDPPQDTVQSDQQSMGSGAGCTGCPLPCHRPDMMLRPAKPTYKTMTKRPRRKSCRPWQSSSAVAPTSICRWAKWPISTASCRRRSAGRRCHAVRLGRAVLLITMLRYPADQSPQIVRLTRGDSFNWNRSSEVPGTKG
jgi:hypothetical protein